MKREFTEEYLKKNRKQRQLWNGEEMIINPYYKEKKTKKVVYTGTVDTSIDSNPHYAFIKKQLSY